MALEKNGLYPAVVGGYTGDGCGVARVEGQVVFVRGALRGERALVRVEHVGHGAAWGRVERLERVSPARVEPDCPLYGSCGGCQFRHMDYAEELTAKGERVEDALRRIGGVELELSALHGAHDILRYRNKVQMPVTPEGIGYYRARSHRVVEVDDCLLQPAGAAACRRAVAEWMEQCHAAPYDERGHRGLVRHLFLRFNQAGEALCCIVANGSSLPQAHRLVRALRDACPGLAGVVLSVHTGRSNVVLGREFRTLWGRDWLEERLCGLSFRIRVPSFFQVNRAQTQVLYARAGELAKLTGGETVLDLYCGAGTIGLTLANRAGQVIGVESVPQAVEDARENAGRNHIANARFLLGDAGNAAARLAREGIRPHVVVVDPPRKGLAPQLPDTITEMSPDRVVYVSCDPATLARDVGRFAALGYRAVRAEAVDMFPRTGHVETVCLLTRMK